MAIAHRVLSGAKYQVARFIPAKLYWTVMGSIRPVAAVTSGRDNLVDSIESGLKTVELLDALGILQPGATSLHIGCGIGRIEKHLAQRIACCYGIDIAPSMLKRARNLVQESNVHFLLGNGRDLSPVSDDSIDLVISFFVFQHLPRDQFGRYLLESKRVLKQDGILVFQAMIDPASAFPEPPAQHPYGLRRYRKDEIVGSLRDAGFSEPMFSPMGFEAARPDSTQDFLILARSA